MNHLRIMLHHPVAVKLRDGISGELIRKLQNDKLTKKIVTFGDLKEWLENEGVAVEEIVMNEEDLLDFYTTQIHTYEE